MARDESGPWARGETYANGNLEILNAASSSLGLGGINLEGKRFRFEPNSQDDEAGVYSNLGPDPCGRVIDVKVVRNVSGVSLKPGRVARYEVNAGTTATPFETRVDGYCTSVNDRPAGIIDEFLPAAGVPNQDLFYIVTRGPSLVSTGATTSNAVNIGDRIVPDTTGATAGDDLGGRFKKQDLSGATTPLGENLQNLIGFSATTFAATTIINKLVPCIVAVQE